MFWVVICVLILCCVESRQPKKDRSYSLVIVFGAVVGLFIYLTLGILIGEVAQKEYQEECVKKLYALEDGNNLQGGFFLASGYIDDEPVIKYITDGEFGKEIKTVETEECYINETDDEICLKIMESKFKNKWVKLFSPYERFHKYVFYVPNGSVINQYNIDLQ